MFAIVESRRARRYSNVRQTPVSLGGPILIAKRQDALCARFGELVPIEAKRSCASVGSEIGLVRRYRLVLGLHINPHGAATQEPSGRPGVICR
jgi:hypothetical protein